MDTGSPTPIVPIRTVAANPAATKLSSLSLAEDDQARPARSQSLDRGALPEIGGGRGASVAHPWQWGLPHQMAWNIPTSNAMGYPTIGCSGIHRIRCGS